jgi:thiamine kinase-like enzyme
MKSTIYREALDAFTDPFSEYDVKSLTGGLINQSFKITHKKTGESVLLQKINEQVFRTPADVQYNYGLLWNYLISEKINFTLPEPKFFSDGSLLFIDSRQHYWRIFEFINEAITFSIAENPQQAHSVANTFAQFTGSFVHLNADQLQITIPDFHNLSFRFQQFRESLHRHHYDRLKESAGLIAELRAREHYASFYEIITASEEFPKRVMHHDAKISNVLFHEETLKVICPVDFDTVMPGYFFSDLGDMIRSMACSHDENSVEFDMIHIRSDFYTAIVEGYLQIMNTHFTTAEKKYIHSAGIIMIYMQALRFLTDFLNGDVYYRVTHPGQNFERAMNQFTLLKSLEQFLEKEYRFKI